MNLSVIGLLGLLVPLHLLAAGGMPHQAKVHAISIDHLEWQGAGVSVLELDGWYGDGLDKIIYKVNARHTQGNETEREVDLGWQAASSPFMDVKFFARYETEDNESRYWAGGGFTGTLPYFVHVDAVLLFGRGDTLLDVEFEHEIAINRSWYLESKLEFTGITGDKSGIDEISLGVRVGHESVKRFRKYVGVEWQKSPLEGSNRTALVAGLSYWH